jgi:Trk K+ transport system NAD-binding subunit
MSIATRVGQTVCRPWRAYHSARNGSRTRAITVGAGLETEALEAAGIDEADVFIASTDGDNTNIVIAQIAQRRYEVPTVIARVLDPLRAEWYQRQGVHTVCPTRVAIDMLESAIRDGNGRDGGSGEPQEAEE